MGQGGAAFGITLLMLAYGGVGTPGGFARAFAAGAALSAVSVATAFFMGRERIELHDAIPGPQPRGAQATPSSAGS